MATKVVMAQLSPTMEEGRLVEWKVSEGDEVSQGEVVAEIETDKANMDVEAMGSGVLRKIVLEEGKTAPVGALIGIIADPDEDISALLEEAGAPAGEAEASEAAEAPAAAEGEEEEPEEEPVEEEAVEEEEEAARPRAGGAAAVEEAEAEAAEEEEAAGAPERERAAAGRRPGPRGGDGRVKASPVARKIASELGLDLSRIEGSGPAGRVVKADVEAAHLQRGAGAAGPARLREAVEEASPMRKTIARRLAQSIGPVPHFFLTIEVDMGRALELRAALNERLARSEEGEEPARIGVNDLLLKAAAEALVRHPEVNASWEEDAVRYHGTVDLGIAVAVEQGLITPVLRDADRKGLRRIAAEASELIDRARRRRLAPEEYQGATFSVSNLGMYGIDEFTAIINPPEAGILAVGRTAEKPVVVDGEVVVRRRMRVTMSCDHRVVDGATGARFLATFRAMLENPLEMVL